IWGDNDNDGRKAAMQVQGRLEGRAEVVQPDPAWAKGWDLADALKEGWDTARVLAWLEAHITKIETPQFQRRAVQIAGGDLEAKTQIIWNSIKLTNEATNAPWIVMTANGLAHIDRDTFGRARRTLIEPDLLRCVLCQRLDFKRFDRNGNPVSCTPSD